MACLELDMCNYLESADNVDSPISGYGAYSKTKQKQYQQLLFEQQDKIRNLRKKFQRLKKKLNKFKQKKATLSQKEGLTPEERNYIDQLEKIILSTTSKMATYEDDIKQAQQGFAADEKV